MTESASRTVSPSFTPLGHPTEPSSAADGLSSVEARRRLARDGLNELAPSRRFSMMREALRGLANPLVLILLIAAGVAGAVGQRLDAAIVVLMVVLSAT